ncbi:hypothetical protein DFS33DRAFT_1374093 [Desarmillaria ectypa]|nr:hypothetical protein DFS33DRAFT_1374093 [Desarmillaria ectypa]
MLRQSDLQGFDVPGYDNFEELTEILDDWCIASGAKFNINKTEILPIGVPSHRNAVHRYRNSAGLDMTGFQIPEEIRVAMDGEAVHTLGAWLGNRVKQVDELGHPTMEGHRLIILMVVSGMIQYLTKVQGMPPDVERWLERRTWKFLWGTRIR